VSAAAVLPDGPLLDHALHHAIAHVWILAHGAAIAARLAGGVQHVARIWPLPGSEPFLDSAKPWHQISPAFRISLM